MISIISGAYNISNNYTFHKSMNSILNQTYKDFEFIICDDGSTDDTWNLLNEYAKNDKRIILLKNEKNLGLAASLNKCIAIAKGEFIARHDLDDYNDLTRFEKQVKFLKENPKISVLGTSSYLFNEDGVWGKVSSPARIENKNFLMGSPYRHGSVMFRTADLKKANGYRVCKETRRAEDFDLFMRLQTFCKGANLSECLYYYCEDKNGLKRRKYRYRLDEAKVRFHGYKLLKLFPKGLFFVIKPLIVGLLPKSLIFFMQNKFYKRKLSKDEILATNEVKI